MLSAGNIESRPNISRRDFGRLVAVMGFSAALEACSSRALVPIELPATAIKTPFEPETPTPEPTGTPSPTDTPTPEPSPTPDTRGVIEKYFYPALTQVTNERRNQKVLTDPEYLQRVERSVNENFIHFMFLGRRGLLTDSIQIMSLYIPDNEIKTTAMHRDTLAPEISRIENTDTPYRINQAYAFGKIPLTEKVLESATGLSSDFLFVTEMNVLPRIVKELFDDRLEVELPWAIPDGRYYFPAGRQVLQSWEILRIARARYYGSNLQRNIVQQSILRAMYTRAEEEIGKGPLNAAEFIGKSLIFFQREKSSGAIDTNFDLSIILNLGEELIRVISQEGIDSSQAALAFPRFSDTYHIDAERARLPRGDRYILKPIDGDPFSDNLLADYWLSSRKEVREFLLEDQ